MIVNALLESKTPVYLHYQNWENIEFCNSVKYEVWVKLIFLKKENFALY